MHPTVPVLATLLTACSGAEPEPTPDPAPVAGEATPETGALTVVLSSQGDGEIEPCG